MVVIEGKVDGKEERKKVLAEKAELYIVPEGVAPPPPRVRPAVLEAAVLGADMPDAFPFEGDELPEPVDFPDEPFYPDMDGEAAPVGRSVGVLEGEAPAQPHPVAARPAASAGNGNGYSNGGNGHANGNGNGQKKANGDGNGGKNGGDHKPCHLRVTLRRHGSDQDDLELLRQVCRTLGAWNGQDSYELCVENGRGRTILKSERARTSFNRELEMSLKELLGPDCLSVCEPVAV